MVVEEGNKKHWGGKIINIVEERKKTLRRENNKIVEKEIKKLRREIKLIRESGKYNIVRNVKKYI